MASSCLHHRLVGPTTARLRKDVAWLCASTPHITFSLQSREQKCYASSQPSFSWGHRLPAKVQAAAGIAAEVKHEESQRQNRQEQRLPQSPAPSPQTGSTINHVQHTGAFARLPMVPVSTEIIESALKRAGRVAANKKLKNEAQKARSRAAKQMDTLTKEVAVPLGVYMKGFPTLHRLHPFEQAMLELTWGTQTYERVLSKVDSLRKSVLQVGKGYAGRANKAATKAEAAAICQEGFDSVEALYLKLGGCIDDLKQVAQKLRRLPVVDPSLPVVALVGAPNVGKSSLVNVLSSGVPEVCDYPFTTRSIKMGHFYVDGQRHQVTDTPGLLARPLSERNAMERLTLACLNHLPSAVLFVLDLTAQCGTSVQDQLSIRQSLKQSFPDKLWLDIFSKSDLLTAHFQAADALRRQENGAGTATVTVPSQQQADVADTLSSSQPPACSSSSEPGRTGSAHSVANSRVHASAAQPEQADLETDDAVSYGHQIESQAAEHQNGSLNESNSQEADMHAAVEHAAQADLAGPLREEQEEWGGVLDPTNSMREAVEAALMLPAALRISSVTQAGIQHLQLATMQMLSSSSSSIQQE